MKDLTPAINLMQNAKHFMAHTYKVVVQTFAGIILNEFVAETLKDWTEVKGFTPLGDEEVDEEVFRIMAMNKKLAAIEPSGVV